MERKEMERKGKGDTFGVSANLLEHRELSQDQIGLATMLNLKIVE